MRLPPVIGAWRYTYYSNNDHFVPETAIKEETGLVCRDLDPDM